MKMEEIIQPVDKELMKSELNLNKRLRRTNKADNEIYIFTAHDSPHLMREVGRLREIAFRHYGGGTGKEVDIDKYDIMENPYRQLIVWDPEKEEILGGYRFITGANAPFDENGKPMLATAHLLNFSQKFIEDFLPYTVELGRSFVSLEYQSTLRSRKGIFALDNLWDGLGALTVVDPTLKYFFGKVTMYGTYNKEARNMILYFLHKHFPDKDQLITPITPLQTNTDLKKMQELFSGKTFKEDYKTLSKQVRDLGLTIPPLINAYMGLSPDMRFFGTSINDEFGNVEESGILIEIDQILEEKKQRHIQSYLQHKPTATLLNRLYKIISGEIKKPKIKTLKIKLPKRKGRQSR